MLVRGFIFFFFNFCLSSFVFADLPQEESVVIQDFEGNKICPVFFEEQLTKKEFYIDHEGKKIYFCCQQCIEYFQNNPDYFFNRLKKQESALFKKGLGKEEKKHGQE